MSKHRLHQFKFRHVLQYCVLQVQFKKPYVSHEKAHIENKVRISKSHEVHLHGQLGVPVFEVLPPAFDVKEILVAGICLSVVAHSGIEVECASRTDDLLNNEHRWVRMMRYLTSA